MNKKDKAPFYSLYSILSRTFNTLRLFIAINFSPRFTAALTGLSEELAAQAVFCRATAAENFHLTLAFIGESQRAEDIKALLEPGLGPAFTLVTARVGCFRRPGGDVCWLGVKPDPRLNELQAEIASRLTAAGFKLEQRPFRPHLTLLRQAAFPAGFDLRRWGRDLPALHERCCRVSLMESRRERGKLIYEELYGRELD